MLIVLAVVLALFWSVHPFFMWVLIGALTLVSFLYYRSLPKTERDYRYQREEEKGADPRTRTPDVETPAQAPKQKKRQNNSGASTAATPQQHVRAITIAVFVLVGVIFLGIILAVIFSPEDAEPPSETEVLQQTLAANPNDVDALTNLGNYHFDQVAYDSALSYYDRVLRIDSRNSPALYNKGLVYYKRQEYETSISVLRQCVDADPNNLDALVVLGHNYYDRQQYDPAQEWYGKAYEKGMRDSFLCHALAWMYDQKNQTTRALALYKEAVGLDSTRADIYPRLAELEPGRASLYRELEQRWKQPE